MWTLEWIDARLMEMYVLFWIMLKLKTFVTTNIHAYTRDIHKYPVLFHRILGFSVEIVHGIPNEIHQEKENWSRNTVSIFPSSTTAKSTRKNQERGRKCGIRKIKCRGWMNRMYGSCSHKVILWLAWNRKRKKKTG